MELQTIPDRVTDLLGPVGKTGAVVEIVKYDQRTNPPTLSVTVDKASGTESLDLDEISEVSRLISQLLDDADLIETEYTLEVTTPGADSPLTQRRHFERNIGRDIEGETVDGQEFSGLLEAAGPTAFSLASDVGIQNIDYADVLRAAPRILFSR